MDESEIVSNLHVFVSIVGREIEEKVPLKPLILTPPAKSVTIAFRWDFIGSFFVYASLTSSANRKTKNYQSEQDVDRPLRNIKLDRHLVPTGSFWFFSLLMMSGTRTQKNCQCNPSGRQFSTIFAGGVSMSSLSGTFSSISRPSMETKTCRFGDILDSSTCSTSRNND